jgi:hypothetical protein
MVGAATVAVNGLAYLVPVAAARLLLPSDLGVLASLLAILAVTAVVGLGLQTALAVRWARQEAVAGAGRVSLATAVITTAALILAAPGLAAVLDLPVYQPLLVAAMTFPVVLAGRWLGELQGRQRYGRLAAGMVMLGLARYGGLLAALWAGQGVTISLVAGTAGAALAVAALPLLCKDKHAAAITAPESISARDVIRASSATTAMLAVSYADVILARAVLPAAEAGAYAVGSVLTRGALWAPGVLTVLALPLFARGQRNAVRVTLAGVAATGAILVVIAAIAGDLAVRLAGGEEYVRLGDSAAAFAAIGALYALVFVVVNAEIAAGSPRPAMVLWLALGTLVAIGALQRPSTVDAVLALALTTAAASALAMGTVYAVRRRRQAPTTTPPAGMSTVASSTPVGNA